MSLRLRVRSFKTWQIGSIASYGSSSCNLLNLQRLQWRPWRLNQSARPARMGRIRAKHSVPLSTSTWYLLWASTTGLRGLQFSVEGLLSMASVVLLS